jgi:site-specific DNA-methyltransferase (adenine-specific)
VWGTNGPRKAEGPVFPGFYRLNVARNKRHMTEKPMTLMGELVKIAWRESDTILDPFMGSGTTLKAAMEIGRRCIGIELSEAICRTAVERLDEPTQNLLKIAD